MISLNAGCGAHYVDGWFNVDVEPRHRADLHADLANLPLPDASVQRVFAAHVLEHLEFYKQLPTVLAEFRRVLADDGELCVVGPDVERAVCLGEPARVLRAVIAWPCMVCGMGEWRKSSYSTEACCVEVRMDWRKSSYSTNNATCVEVREAFDRVDVRDSKDPDGPVLAFDRTGFSDFVDAVKRGQFS